MTGKKPRKLKRNLTAQPVDTIYPALDATLAQMDAIERAWAEGKTKFLQFEAWALRFMKEKGIDTYNGTVFRGTPVYPTGEIIDWEGIEAAVGPAKWKKILGPPQPDKSKLEALIELKVIPAEVVDEYIADKPIKPFIRRTRIQKS